MSILCADANNPQPPTPPIQKRMQAEERVTRARRGPPRKTYADSGDDDACLYHVIRNARISLQVYI